MSKNYQNVNNLRVSEELLSFVNNELLKGLEISPEKFWSGFDNAVHELAPKNKELIELRKDLQKKALLLRKLKLLKLKLNLLKVLIQALLILKILLNKNKKIVEFHKFLKISD